MEPLDETATLTIPAPLFARLEAAAALEGIPTSELACRFIRQCIGQLHERRVIRTQDMSAAELELIARTEMDPRHNYLDAELEEEPRQ